MIIQFIMPPYIRVALILYQFVAAKSVFKEKLTKQSLISFSNYYGKIYS